MNYLSRKRFISRMTREIINIYLSTIGMMNPRFYVRQNRQEFEIYRSSKCRSRRAVKYADESDIYLGPSNSFYSCARSTRVSSSVNGQVPRAKSFMFVRTNLNVASIQCEQRTSTMRTGVVFDYSNEQHLKKNK